MPGTTSMRRAETCPLRGIRGKMKGMMVWMTWMKGIEYIRTNTRNYIHAESGDMPAERLFYFTEICNKSKSTLFIHYKQELHPCGEWRHAC